MKELQRSNMGSIWKAKEKGEAITGEYLGSRTVVGDYGKQTAIDLKTKDGQVTVFASKVLEDYLGDMVKGKVYKIAFLGWGKDRAAKRTDKNRYRVFKVYEP